MPTHFRSRPWTSRADLGRIQALATARIALDWPHIRFHPGDLDWWVVGAWGRVPGVEERVRLWFDADNESEDAPGALRAFGWFGPPNDLDFLTASDDPAEVGDLIREIVDWGEERHATYASADKPGPMKVWASTLDPVTPSLVALGFEPDSADKFVHLTGDLSVADGWPPPAIPDGLSIRSLTDADVEARVVCGRAAFNSTMTPERYRTVYDANLYRQDLDVLMVDGDGRVVAFTLAWLDPVSGVVELEPVAVHPDFHRRGYGRQVCQAALRRARDLGATRAVIGAEYSNPASVGLYQNLGLSITTEIVKHSRG